MQPFPELCVPQCVCAKMFVLFLNLPLLNFEEEPKCYIYVNVRQIPPGFFYILPQFCSRSIAINASGGHRRGRGQEGRGSRTRGGRGSGNNYPVNKRAVSAGVPSCGNQGRQTRSPFTKPVSRQHGVFNGMECCNNHDEKKHTRILIKSSKYKV